MQSIESIINAVPLATTTGITTETHVPAPVTTASNAAISGTLVGEMVFKNPSTGEEMVRIAKDGFYVHGKKLEQPETEARELFDAMMNWSKSR